MSRLLSVSHERVPAETCVWMDAGVLAYKLCDRGFDCSHCPLDAALRGLSGTPTQPDDERSEPGAPPLAFPHKCHH